MIPSLSGGLYKFDGGTIEPIPVNAERLLSTSFKFSDDLVISGIILLIDNPEAIDIHYLLN